MDALRKTYQRAVQVPLNNVEQIWQEYNQFENNLSKMTVSFLLMLCLSTGVCVALRVVVVICVTDLLCSRGVLTSGEVYYAS